MQITAQSLGQNIGQHLSLLEFFTAPGLNTGEGFDGSNWNRVAWGKCTGQPGGGDAVVTPVTDETLVG